MTFISGWETYLNPIKLQFLMGRTHINNAFLLGDEPEMNPKRSENLRMSEKSSNFTWQNLYFEKLQTY